MESLRASLIIQNALAAVKAAQDLFLQKLRDNASNHEEIKTFIRKILADSFADSFNSDALIDPKERAVDVQALMGAAHQFTTNVMGPHQREIRSAQHQQLSKLAELSLDDYCCYCDELEKLATEFSVQLNELIQQHTLSIMPEILTEIIGDDFSSEFRPNMQIGSDGWLQPENDE